MYSVSLAVVLLDKTPPINFVAHNSFSLELNLCKIVLSRLFNCGIEVIIFRSKILLIISVSFLSFCCPHSYSHSKGTRQMAIELNKIDTVVSNIKSKHPALKTEHI